MQTAGSPAKGAPCGYFPLLMDERESIIVKNRGISLSKGGFYYYYKSTIDILHDLMKKGMAYRISKMNKFMAEYATALDK